ncbi:hypothetical protein EJ08DRAFT_285397 [Tothia fuscella]|uniref:Uncharacterized protein n=1 Tax=Tothia fuscella TaxID=1048955 RepID=A0A9P4P2Z8_9PEZI|nr:hypothetical protein EJ08DRAFT_285397 [Tothia fuscella]
MTKQTFVSLLALASLIPSSFSAPVLGREECICQPIDLGSADNNSSIASCEAIARDIQSWRALAFHSPFLADVFVDAEPRLQVPKRGGHLEKRRFAHELRTIHRPRDSLRSFNQAVRNVLRRTKKLCHGHSKEVVISQRAKSSLEPPTASPLHGPSRPTWPWEGFEHQDRSPGRAVEKASKPQFLHASHRYRIMCRSKDVPRAVVLAARPDLMLVASIIIVAIWLFVCDMLLAICRNYFSPSDAAVEEGIIVLAGDEKKIHAYQIEELDEGNMDAKSLPAIADL